jgi:hypothetical protein
MTHYETMMKSLILLDALQSRLQILSRTQQAASCSCILRESISQTKGIIYSNFSFNANKQ